MRLKKLMLSAALMAVAMSVRWGMQGVEQQPAADFWFGPSPP